MTPEELAALERVISAAENHPLALLFSSADRARAIANARRIARDGLSRREAERIVAIVSDRKQRELIERVLSSVANQNDVLVVMAWLVNDITAAMSEPEEPDNIPPAATATFALPWLCLPITCGFYADRQNLDSTLVSVAKLAKKHNVVGQLGVDVEGTGDLGNPGANLDSLFDSIRARFTFLANVLVPRCVQLGLPVKITAGNSNDFGKGFKKVWKDTPRNRAAYVELHKRFAEQLVLWSDAIIVQAIAETDGSMAADFRRACQRAWTDAGFPKHRMAAENREGGAAFSEIHIKSPAGVVAGKNDYISTDNNKGIPAHFEPGGPFDAYKPRVDACIKSALQYASNGAPFSLYHRVTTLEIISQIERYDAIIGGVRDVLRRAPAQPGTSPPYAHEQGGPADDAIPVSKVHIIGKNKKDPALAKITRALHKASISGNRITLATDKLNWPTVSGKKTTDGGVCIVWPEGDGYIGGWFDHHGVNQTVKGLENITGGYIDKRQPQKGAKCYIYLISYDGKQRTNIVEAGKW